MRCAKSDAPSRYQDVAELRGHPGGADLTDGKGDRYPEPVSISPPSHFLPRFDFNECTVQRPSFTKERALTAGRWWWWVEHALCRGQPIRVPTVFGELRQPMGLNGFVVREIPGVYRAEIIGPAAKPGAPRTGVPIATVFTFERSRDRRSAFEGLWARIFKQYGADYRTPFPGEDCFLVIRHAHLAATDNAATEALIRSLCDGIGYGAHLHSSGIPAPSAMRSSYSLGLTFEEADAVGFLR